MPVRLRSAVPFYLVITGNLGEDLVSSSVLPCHYGQPGRGSGQQFRFTLSLRATWERIWSAVPFYLVITGNLGEDLVSSSVLPCHYGQPGRGSGQQFRFTLSLRATWERIWSAVPFYLVITGNLGEDLVSSSVLPCHYGQPGRGSGQQFRFTLSLRATWERIWSAVPFYLVITGNLGEDLVSSSVLPCHYGQPGRGSGQQFHFTLSLRATWERIWSAVPFYLVITGNLGEDLVSSSVLPCHYGQPGRGSGQQFRFTLSLRATWERIWSAVPFYLVITGNLGEDLVSSSVLPCHYGQPGRGSGQQFRFTLSLRATWERIWSAVPFYLVITGNLGEDLVSSSVLPCHYGQPGRGSGQQFRFTLSLRATWERIWSAVPFYLVITGNLGEDLVSSSVLPCHYGQPGRGSGQQFRFTLSLRATWERIWSAVPFYLVITGNLGEDLVSSSVLPCHYGQPGRGSGQQFRFTLSLRATWERIWSAVPFYLVITGNLGEDLVSSSVLPCHYGQPGRGSGQQFRFTLSLRATWERIWSAVPFYLVITGNLGEDLVSSSVLPCHYGQPGRGSGQQFRFTLSLRATWERIWSAVPFYLVITGNLGEDLVSSSVLPCHYGQPGRGSGQQFRFTLSLRATWERIWSAVPFYLVITGNLGEDLVSSSVLPCHYGQPGRGSGQQFRFTLSLRATWERIWSAVPFYLVITGNLGEDLVSSSVLPCHYGQPGRGSGQQFRFTLSLRATWERIWSAVPFYLVITGNLGEDLVSSSVLPCHYGQPGRGSGQQFRFTLSLRATWERIWSAVPFYLVITGNLGEDLVSSSVLPCHYGQPGRGSGQQFRFTLSLRATWERIWSAVPFYLVITGNLGEDLVSSSVLPCHYGQPGRGSGQQFRFTLSLRATWERIWSAVPFYLVITGNLGEDLVSSSVLPCHYGQPGRGSGQQFRFTLSLRATWERIWSAVPFYLVITGNLGEDLVSSSVLPCHYGQPGRGSGQQFRFTLSLRATWERIWSAVPFYLVITGNLGEDLVSSSILPCHYGQPGRGSGQQFRFTLSLRATWERIWSAVPFYLVITGNLGEDLVSSSVLPCHYGQPGRGSGQQFRFTLSLRATWERIWSAVPFYLVITGNLGEDLWELRQLAQLHQVQPGHVRDPLLGLGLHRVQIQRSTTWGGETTGVSQ